MLILAGHKTGPLAYLPYIYHTYMHHILKKVQRPWKRYWFEDQLLFIM